TLTDLRMMTVRLKVPVVLAAALMVGCSRSHYRRSADIEAYSIVREKTCDTPWDAGKFSIEQPARSRLADPSCCDCPPLPSATPQLHSYQLPPMTPRQQQADCENSTAAQRLADPTPHGTANGIQLTVHQAVVGNCPAATHRTEAGPALDLAGEYSPALPGRPIPESAWRALPPECLAPMLE